MMKPYTEECPSADALAAVAYGYVVPPLIDRHIRACESCGRAVDQLRRDARLIQELREAALAALDDDTHRDVMNACRAAAGDTD